MLLNIRTFIGGIILVGYVLSSSGCVVGWFLAGAGTATAVKKVMDDDKKEKELESEISVEDDEYDEYVK